MKKSYLDKEPLYGVYIPSEFPTQFGDLLINFKIDNPKYILFNSGLPDNILEVIKDFYKDNPLIKYTKACVRRNASPDKDGNLYFAFLNTYDKDKCAEETILEMDRYVKRIECYLELLKQDIKEEQIKLCNNGNVKKGNK